MNTGLAAAIFVDNDSYFIVLQDLSQKEIFNKVSELLLPRPLLKNKSLNLFY